MKPVSVGDEVRNFLAPTEDQVQLANPWWQNICRFLLARSLNHFFYLILSSFAWFVGQIRRLKCLRAHAVLSAFHRTSERGFLCSVRRFDVVHENLVNLPNGNDDKQSRGTATPEEITKGTTLRSGTLYWRSPHAFSRSICMRKAKKSWGGNMKFQPKKIELSISR